MVYPNFQQSGFGWAVMLLPQMDQSPLYNQLAPGSPLDLVQDVAIPARLTLLQTPLPASRCPSDTAPEVNSDRPTVSGALLATANYVGNAGTNTGNRRGVNSNGIFYPNSRIQFRDITDGTSHTLAVGERAWHDVAGTGKGSAGLWAGTTRQDIPPMSDNVWSVLAIAHLRMNSGRFDPTPLSSAPRPEFAFTSPHEGGGLFLLCDGAVRFISENVDFAEVTTYNASFVSTAPDNVTRYGVYQRLSVRDDGQPIGEF
jgi:hypothetical protein